MNNMGSEAIPLIGWQQIASLPVIKAAQLPGSPFAMTAAEALGILVSSTFKIINISMIK